MFRGGGGGEQSYILINRSIVCIPNNSDVKKYSFPSRDPIQQRKKKKENPQEHSTKTT